MKTLVLYTDVNLPGFSQQFRAAANTAGIPFTELRLDRDGRQHPTLNAGVEAVIDVDGFLALEIQNPANLAARWAATPDVVPVRPVDPIAALRNKASNTWTLADVADFLKLLR